MRVTVGILNCAEGDQARRERIIQLCHLVVENVKWKQRERERVCCSACGESYSKAHPVVLKTMKN